MSILGSQPAPSPLLPEPPGPTSGAGGRSQLSEGVRIVGEFQAPGHVELSGRIEGAVRADSVVVEREGAILGEVHAAVVGIKGRFEGTMAAGAVRLHATARVTGTVLYDTLAIEPGAEVTAAFRRNAAPKALAEPAAG